MARLTGAIRRRVSSDPGPPPGFPTHFPAAAPEWTEALWDLLSRIHDADPGETWHNCLTLLVEAEPGEPITYSSEGP